MKSLILNFFVCLGYH